MYNGDWTLTEHAQTFLLRVPADYAEAFGPFHTTSRIEPFATEGWVKIPQIHVKIQFVLTQILPLQRYLLFFHVNLTFDVRLHHK